MSWMLWEPKQMPDGHEIPSSLTGQEVARLQRLARGRRVLEIGSAFGYSTIKLAQVAARVCAVDPHSEECLSGSYDLRGSKQAMLANLKRYKVEDKVEVIQQRSEDVLPGMIEEGRRFDLAFVDGNHDYAVQADVSNCLQLLADDGWLAVHDFGWSYPEIDRVLNQLGKPDVVCDSLWCARKSSIISLAANAKVLS